ncbi:MAG: transcriptional repressor [Clostridia bacterium]|nr:transcriptional repressor [Clostridia bacterium]MDE7306554.1 transcriptional repressor [Clostridia bacterium]
MKTSRNTPQKRIIMQALMQADHPTASELYESIRKDNGAISRATVFRVLSQFAESGKVLKLNVTDGTARYDPCTTPHAHLICCACGKVADAESEEFKKLADKKQIDGFEIYTSRIEFIGLCKNCKAKLN